MFKQRIKSIINFESIIRLHFYQVFVVLRLLACLLVVSVIGAQEESAFGFESRETAVRDDSEPLARDPRCPLQLESDDAIFYPHNFDCNKFYACATNGSLVEKECLPGTEFDPELLVRAQFFAWMIYFQLVCSFN